MSKPGRNDPCPCGSGKKYKNCCANKPEAGDATIEQAVQWFQQAEWQKALEVCQQILATRPNDGDANHIGGLALCQMQQFQEARPMLRKAVKALPQNPWVHTNLGLCLQYLEDFPRAEASCRAAIKLDAQFAEAHHVLANILRETSRLEESLQHYEQAITLDSGQPGYFMNLGLAYQLLQRYQESEQAYRQSLQLNPRLAESYCNLGVLYRDLGMVERAHDVLQQAMELDPENLTTLNSWGLVMESRGDFAQAMEIFQKALQMPWAPEAMQSNLENVIKQQQQQARALSIYRSRFADDADFARNYDALLVNGEDDNIDERGDADLALSLETLLQLADWPRYEQALQRWSTYVLQGGSVSSSLLSIGLMQSQYSTALSPEDRRRLHLAWGEQVVEEAASGQPIEYEDPRKKTRLRIGYISADFRHHSVGYFIRNVIASHDYDKYEVFCYYNHPRDDDLTEAISEHCTELVTIHGLDDAALQQRIQQDQIDVLIDLSGHTHGTRLPALASRQAPLQMTYLGYPDSTGLPTIDYRIVDAITDPEDASTQGSEKLLRLPQCFLSFGTFSVNQEHTSAPAGENGFVTFGSFNKVAKLTPGLIGVWAQILISVPNSKMVIKARGTCHHVTRKNVLDEFGKHEIAPERIILMDRMVSKEAHFHAYRDIDIALDTFPYNGTTTTCEALWMGVPVVALVGKEHKERVSASILRAAGLQQTCARDVTQYLDIAIQLANNLEQLSALRSDISRKLKDSILCQPDVFTRQLEDAISSCLAAQ